MHVQLGPGACLGRSSAREVAWGCARPRVGVKPAVGGCLGWEEEERKRRPRRGKKKEGAEKWGAAGLVVLGCGGGRP